ncbi:tail fiber domain-containing protein [bacterium]|nr:tail fiber domain-containing protein [bacterium]
MKKRFSVNLVVLFAVSFLMVCGVRVTIAAERLIVKDDGGTQTFSVDEDGTVFAKGNIGIGKASPEACSLLDAEGFDDTGYGTALSIRNTNTSSNSFAVFEMFVGSGLEGGCVFGSLAALPNWGIVNGFTFSPGTSQQDIGFRMGDALSGTATGPALIIKSSGNIGIGALDPGYLIETAGGAYCDGNDWYPASSRDYKEEIEKLDPIAALKALDQLEPVTYRYKNQDGWERKRVGFIAEDMPAMLAVPGKKSLSNTDIIATLTQVVKEQQKALAQLNKRLQELEK